MRRCVLPLKVCVQTFKFIYFVQIVRMFAQFFVYYASVCYLHILLQMLHIQLLMITTLFDRHYVLLPFSIHNTCVQYFFIILFFCCCCYYYCCKLYFKCFGLFCFVFLALVVFIFCLVFITKYGKMAWLHVFAFQNMQSVYWCYQHFCLFLLRLLLLGVFIFKIFLDFLANAVAHSKLLSSLLMQYVYVRFVAHALNMFQQIVHAFTLTITVHVVYIYV